MTLPTITCTKVRRWTGGEGNYEQAEYTLTGGDITPEWRKHADERGGRVECRVTITATPNGWQHQPRENGGGVYLGSFGGHVWPSAWPQLFETCRLLGNQATRLTPLAEQMFTAALDAYEAGLYEGGHPDPGTIDWDGGPEIFNARAKERP